MCWWCLFFGLHLTTHHSIIGLYLRIVCISTPAHVMMIQLWAQLHKHVWLLDLIDSCILQRLSFKVSKLEFKCKSYERSMKWRSSFSLDNHVGPPNCAKVDVSYTTKYLSEITGMWLGVNLRISTKNKFDYVLKSVLTILGLIVNMVGVTYMITYWAQESSLWWWMRYSYDL